MRMGEDLSGSLSGANRIALAPLSAFSTSSYSVAAPTVRVTRPEVVASTSTTTAGGGVTVAPEIRTGACGAEPARRPPDALGIARYVDPAAGAKYDACIAAQQLAREKAFFDAIQSRSAGGADGCGPDVTNVYNSGSQYTGKPLRAAWDACRAAALAAAAVAPAQPVTKTPIAVEQAAPQPSSERTGEAASAPALEQDEASAENPEGTSTTERSLSPFMLIAGGVVAAAAVVLAVVYLGDLVEVQR